MTELADPLTLSQLCLLVDLPARTVRYYVQQGLVARPAGETRAARYSQKHVEQLLLIKKWTASGVSLERIRALLHGDEPAPVAARAPTTGSVSVRSHVCVANGIEVVVDPDRAGWSPEQLRRFVQEVMAVVAGLETASPGPDPSTTAPGQVPPIP